MNILYIVCIRLQTVVRALKQTEQSVLRVKDDIERRMAERRPLTEKVVFLAAGTGACPVLVFI